MEYYAKVMITTQNLLAQFYTVLRKTHLDPKNLTNSV